MKHCKWFVVVLGIVAMLSMMVLTSHAGTPDGQTPAVESVCDPLKADGVTHGLYGLCIAFCEAQDSELGEERTAGAELLDAVVAPIRDPDVALGIDRQARRGV